MLFDGLVDVAVAVPLASPDSPEDVEPIEEADGEIIAGV